jgi:carbonic anhydrase
MNYVKPLPKSLTQRYHGWKATQFEDNKAWYAHLADEGQHPRAMVISCCDSRVHVTSMFGAETGEFFIHRNIANLIPPYAPNKDYHGTSAAVEYAVNSLKVANLIVMGHSQCGGVQGCHDMCSGNAPELEEDSSFVGRWMDILRPGYEVVKDMPAEEQVPALERQGVIVSLNNLMTFPFVRDRVDEGTLTLHGVWINIRDGVLENYDTDQDAFVNV